MYVYKKVVFFFLSFFKKIAFSTGNVHYTSYVMFSDVDIKRSQMEQQLADRKKRWPIMASFFFFCFFKKYTQVKNFQVIKLNLFVFRNPQQSL